MLLCILFWHSANSQQNRPVLRFLVLAADVAAVYDNGPDGVDDSALPVLQAADARLLTHRFLGRPIDDALLAEIREQIRSYYDTAGRPFVEIAIPAQDVADGTLRVNVTEKKIGHIKVEGNRWFADWQYTDAIRARVGDPIDTYQLTADTAWLDRNPKRQATALIGPSAAGDTYDVTLKARDSLPLTVSLTADNTGTATTGLYRTGLSLDWSNAFGLGDDLVYGILADPFGRQLLQNQLMYAVSLPWRDTLSINAVLADTRGAEIGSSSTTGRTAILSVRYETALPIWAGVQQHLDFGFDFKSTNTNLLTGGSAVFPTTSELDQFVGAYGGRRDDTAGSTGLIVTFVGSPARLSPSNTGAALASQQPGAKASYVYGRVTVDRMTSLPFDTSWQARITGQYSSANLLPSEQLMFGGIQSVRGFVEQGATRDIGLQMQNDYRLAPIRPGLDMVGDAVPLVFLDLAAGRNHEDFAGARRSWLEMVSAGPGISWQFAPFGRFRFTWGFPLARNGHTGPFLGPQFGLELSF